MNNRGMVAASSLVVLMAVSFLAFAQAPTIEQLRQTVSRLPGNRIKTPNNCDNLTPQQKKYVESIL